jgi:hypothetical protein
MAAVDPADAVAQLFIARCANYQREPPTSEWHGFERLAHK